MDYIAHTESQRREMLRAIGVERVEALFEDIPSALRAGELNLPEGRSEIGVRNHLAHLAAKNATHLTPFVGGGFYDHYVPSAVTAILRRGELYTAYTPYQAEASQGTLQAIYEYQTAVCRLTGMEVANASLYDGGTALYEAAMMAARLTGRNKIVLDSGVNPIYRNMLHGYTRNLNVAFREVPTTCGPTPRDQVEPFLDEETAAIVLQNPNFFGFIDDLADVVAMAHDVGALAVMSCYPLSLGLLKTPGDMGVDIATGEGQSLGLPLSFGGPYLGFMATRKRFIRQMPGRLAGVAEDRAGRRGFVLTLQTREQHIRRQGATSNICTNEALCALAALVYLSLVGKEGLKEVARLSADKAAYAARRLEGIDGVTVHRAAPFFNEFVCDLPAGAGEVVSGLIEKGYAGGFPLAQYYPGMEQRLLVAVTEKRTKEEIGAFAEAVEGLL